MNFPQRPVRCELRAAEVIALRELDAEVCRHIRRPLGLDAFEHRAAAEVACERPDMRDDQLMRVVCFEVRSERVADLDE